MLQKIQEQEILEPIEEEVIEVEVIEEESIIGEPVEAEVFETPIEAIALVDTIQVTVQDLDTSIAVNTIIEKETPKKSPNPKCPFCDRDITTTTPYLHKLFCYKNPKNDY